MTTEIGVIDLPIVHFEEFFLNQLSNECQPSEATLKFSYARMLLKFKGKRP